MTVKEKVFEMEQTAESYETQSLSNGHICLEYLVNAGPRIIGLYYGDSQENLFAILPGVGWKTPYGWFSMYGGHRLWHSPEAADRTSIPDDQPPAIEKIDGGLKISQAVEAPTGIAKSIVVRFQPDRSSVVVDHYLTNKGVWPVPLAPWAITQLRLGGIAVIPQITQPLDSAGLLPNRSLVLWPYTSWQDERLKLHDDLILVEGTPQLPPIKIGCVNPHGWLGYFYKEFMFIKRFDYLPEQPYPDFGSNSECYCNDKFIEVESLGPLTNLEPDQTVQYTETWELHKLSGEVRSIGDIRQVIKEKI